MTAVAAARTVEAVASDLPSFVCPRCRGPVTHEDAGTERERHACAPCGAAYPVVLGIADFRVEPDPWIALEDDREKGRRLAERAAGATFEETVREYWAMTPATPRALAEKFTRYVVEGEARAAEWLDWLERNEAPAPAGPWLDVGCGTADLVAAAAARGTTVVGVDVAFRWLVAARARPRLAGRTRQLVCANAERLPFAAGAFARAVSLGTLEHCRDAGAAVGEARRVLRPRGVLRVRTVNRFTLLREPHVNVWGVGFVPRRWADAYVRWRGGPGYAHHRPLSARELSGALRRARLVRGAVRPAPLLDADRARLGALAWAAPLYDAARRTPGLGAALALGAPVLDARGEVAA